MEELEAPDGTVRSFRPKLAAYYKARGWKATKPAKVKKSTKKAAAASLNDDTPDQGTTQE